MRTATNSPSANRSIASLGACRRVLIVLAVLCASLTGTGCVALSNPVANGVPVRRLPPELMAESRSDKKTIPLTLLRQKPPDAYLLGPGDILGVWVEGIIGDRSQLPPVHIPETSALQPAVGFPLPIREDGTISLPLADPVKLEGLTLEEAEIAIRRALTEHKQLLNPDRARILVTLIKRRTYRVLVVRQEAGGAAGSAGSASTGGGRNISFNVGALSNAGNSGRSTGQAVELPAGENDVLNALVLTGGLPGFESQDEVTIERGSYKTDIDRARIVERFDQGCLGNSVGGPRIEDLGGQITTIPLRMKPSDPLPFRAQDILLYSGDVVYVKPREADLYYTGGLLGAGEFQLPRDYDLTVLQAVIRIGGPVVTGFNANNIQGGITGQGIGPSSPSLLTVLRRTPGGGQLPIKVDMNLALRDPRENIALQAGDILILQEKPSEAMARYFNTFLQFNLFSNFIQGNRTNGTLTLSGP